MKKIIASFNGTGIYINSDYIKKDGNSIDFYRNDCFGFNASVDLTKFRFKFNFQNEYTKYYELVEK